MCYIFYLCVHFQDIIVHRCQQQKDCDGFMVDYRQGACFKVSLGRQYEDLIPTDNVNFFRKVCLKGKNTRY